MFRFSLTRMIRKARGRLRGMIVLRAITPGENIRRPLVRVYSKVTQFWWDGARDQIIPAYAQALREPRPVGELVDDLNTPQSPSVRLSGIIEALGDEAHRLVMSLTYDLQDWEFYVETWHRMHWAGTLQPHNVELKTWIGREDVAQTLGTHLRQNVSLVRNVSDAIRRAYEQIIFDGFQRRVPARVIAKQMSEATGMARKRALRITIDQTQRLSSLLDEERMRQAGLDEYQWQHSGKVHYRPHHKARDGKVFKWGDIDPLDMPGIPPFCGCKKRAVIRFDDGTLPT